MVAATGSSGARKRGLPAFSRHVLSVSSWFRIPEQVRVCLRFDSIDQGLLDTRPCCRPSNDRRPTPTIQGMKEYEPLSRGTAFCIKSKAGSSGTSSRRQRVVVTCSHVVAPYRWPWHFKEPWLEFVKDAHIECRLQVWRVRFALALT